MNKFKICGPTPRHKYFFIKCPQNKQTNLDNIS